MCMYLNLCVEEYVIIFSFNFREFKDVDHRDEPEDLVPVEPEIHIDREQVLARYHVCSYGCHRSNIYSFVFFTGG